MNWIKRIIFGLLGLLVIALVGFVIWAESTSPISAVAEQALVSDEAVTVTQDEWIEFEPIAAHTNPTFIFYPGGRVDENAYAPLARTIAEAGYPTIIVPMPLNLAVLNGNVAEDIIAAHPDVETWAIGGHSLGGAMAARFADQFSAKIEGLILLASFPADSNDLTDNTISVLSIYGTLDGLVEKSEAETPLLPKDTAFVVIDGGNHAYFGDYGEQSGDNVGTISRDEQQAITADAIIAFLADLN